ncbi:hypothetical protein LTS08_003050 [Lithohypha guttulata]|nr:hypothetical protein LTS08_003050 [Lithohypha guttulata]
MYDIRSDKSEQSLLEMVRRSIRSEPKTMPTLLLYDEKGLKIFEEITYLDEYYLTNAELNALHNHADTLIEHIPAGARIIELGSGNLRKVRILLDALERAQKDIDYFALDLSYDELKRTFSEVDTSHFKHVKLNAFHGTYDDGLAWLSRPENKDRVNIVMTLGSSIGNFGKADAAKFLLGFSQALGPADLILVGLDATDDEDRIFRAYNDNRGVTERFYRNGLVHANKLFGYEAFKQDEWIVLGEYLKDENQHRASYVATKDILVDGIEIKKGEKLQFELANKFRDDQSDEIWREAALIPTAVYTDSVGKHQLHILKPAKLAFDTRPDLYAPTPVPAVREWQQLWTVWDIVTRSMVPRDELMNKPIQLRNNLIFYLGHIPTFADIHFTRATGQKPTDPSYYYQIFERGIDPDVDDPTQCHSHSEIPDEWPPLSEILQYQLRIRNRILKSIESGYAAKDRKLARGLVLAFEHEAMHLETFLYMLLHSERILAPPGGAVPDFKAIGETSGLARTENQWHAIPTSKFVIGADDPENSDPPERYFLWDNERPARVVEVQKFEAQSRPISNGEYARFLEDTGKTALPASWVKRTPPSNGHARDEGHTSDGTNEVVSVSFLNGKAVRTVYGPVPLEFALDWPVMASYDEIVAFAKWTGDGNRIPTFEELKSIYHYVHKQERLAEKTPSTLVPAVNGHLSNDGVEETPPQHDLSHGVGEPANRNLNPYDLFIDLKSANVGFKQWYPSPVTADGTRLRGQSDVGGLWEWTSTSFAAHDGFEAMNLYPGYSADFFDEKHNICLGGSWATIPRIAGRKSFINWYQRNYPFVWCTARLVRDVA